MRHEVSFRTFLLPAWLVASASGFAFPADEDLTPKTFESLRQLIRPQPHESRWAKVPWLTHLKDARERAVRLDKPILLWRSGGGDVLGRT